jgi:hypothetical protein
MYLPAHLAIIRKFKLLASLNQWGDHIFLDKQVV